jgi:hypothetical protein
MIDFPVYHCKWPDCGATWMGDDQMYEDPEMVCPKCGRDPRPPWQGIQDELSTLGIGSSKDAKIIYSETAGPIMYEGKGGQIYDYIEASGY